ncbi:MAG: 2,3-bisphosphoglycerate-independent phosphoglycerate mutase [Pyrinomonadaceae bacterium]
MVTVKLGNWSLGFGTDVDSERKRPLVLVILDGWGYSERTHGNAIAMANTPNFDRVVSSFPGTFLAASGTRVGLTPESTGNPEIGHLNIGTGRAVRSMRRRIVESIDDGSFFHNKVLSSAYRKACKRGSAVHLVGLLSNGDVHSTPESLFALLRMAKIHGIYDKVYVHGILDGVDVAPRSADVFVEAIQIKLADIGVGRLATLCGRQYAMDNTENWQRTARAYTMLAHSEGILAHDAVDAIRDSFLRGLSDEFVQPIVLTETDEKPIGAIRDGDVVIFFNHRGDAMAQLVKAVSESQPARDGSFTKPKVDAVCLTEYDPALKLPVAFRASDERNVLSDVLYDNGLTNARFAESSRRKHISYFFNGRDEAGKESEQYFLVDSDELMASERPELGSFKITDRLLRAIENKENDVFIVNLSAADVAARSGNLQKTIEAVQYVDTCLGGIIEKVRAFNGIAIVTADHGNCEDMSMNGKAPTPYTANPVPFVVVGDRLEGLKLREDGALEDIAPTILGILGIEPPTEMTGADLRVD